MEYNPKDVWSKKQGFILLLFCNVFIFVATYTVVLSRYTHSDFVLHAQTAELALKEGLGVLLRETSYPIWQLLVAGISLVLGSPTVISAAIATGLLNVLSYTIVYKYLVLEHKESSRFIMVLSLLFLMIGPLYMPWFNEDVYLGQGTPNIWHNPTTMCVRPFALLTYILVLHILEAYESNVKIEKKNWIGLAILMLICNLAKPSFFQIVVPGLGLYLLLLLIQTKGKAFLFCVKMALAFVPSAVVLIWQFVISFMVSSSAEAGGGIVIAWFEVLRAYTPDLPTSLFLVFAFPVYVLITNWKHLKERDVKLTLFMFLGGFLEAAMLAEEGYRRLHGNLTWGYMLSIFFVYLTAFKYFIKKNKEYNYENTKEKIVVAIGWVLLILQLFIGLYYMNL